MKKILLLLISIFPLCLHAQTPQSSVILKNGTILKGAIKTIVPSGDVTIVISGNEYKIPMTDVAQISDDELAAVDSEKQDTPNTTKEVVDPLSGYKGLLLSKGNNVFVYSNKGEIEEAAAKALKEQLKKDKFWNVVDDIVEAHFTINYYVSFKGRDMVTVTVTSWRKEGSYMILYENTHFNLEEPSTNEIIAKRIYEKEIKKFQKKIETGKLSNELIEKYTIH